MDECKECGETRFYICDGVKLCFECGTEVYGFQEVESQELENEINKTRFFNFGITTKDEKSDEIDGVVWTTYKVFDLLLRKWTETLIQHGASEHLRPVVFTLWTNFLKNGQVAFLKKRKKPKLSYSANKRDKCLLVEGKETICKKDLSVKWKNKKTDHRLNILKSKYSKKQRLTSAMLHNLSRTYDLESMKAKEERDKMQKSNQSKKSKKKKKEEQLCSDEDNNDGKKGRGKKKKQSNISEHFKKYHPTHLNVNKLLSLLYLAVLLIEEDILLMDILRWCEEEHIPFRSAPYLFPPDMKLHGRDIYFISQFYYLPNSQVFQFMSGNIAVFLSLERIPLPSSTKILTRMLNILNLPDSMLSLTEHLADKFLTARKVALSLNSNSFKFPAKEVEAAASIIVCMKLFCGLNDRYEHLLSAIAKRINREFSQQGVSERLFSWIDWKSYIEKMHWWCEQFTLDNITDGNRLVHQFWSEDIWLLHRTSKNQRNGIMYDKLADIQNINIEKLTNQKRLFAPTKDPYMGKVNQFLENKDSMDFGDKELLLKVAEDLKTLSFKKNTFDWAQNLPLMQDKLENCDIHLELKKHACKKVRAEVNKSNCSSNINKLNAKYCCTINSNYEIESVLTATEVINVPQPQFSYWVYKHGDNYERNPSSFMWLVKVLSHLCHTTTQDLLDKVSQLENVINVMNCDM